MNICVYPTRDFFALPVVYPVRDIFALPVENEKQHYKSSKHQTGKKRLEGKDKDEREIADFLKSDDESNHPKGETLPLEQRVYRIKVVNVFLRSDVPLRKIQEFRSILEENGLRLIDRRHMADMIPLVLNKEK